MSRDLVPFLHARLDEEADLARRCGGDDCGEWTAHGHTVDFCQSELPGFHPTTALHVALHDPARVLREVEAKRRVLARHVLSPATGDPELPWDNRDDCQDAAHPAGWARPCLQTGVWLTTPGTRPRRVGSVLEGVQVRPVRERSSALRSHAPAAVSPALWADDASLKTGPRACRSDLAGLAVPGTHAPT
ncbi:DUF6221 family protein [Streptomyces niveus]|uniref:DUF6221 family protein n=2 Tax=Streptomyces niveus TaxID=193462 RepID=UPI003D077372